MSGATETPTGAFKWKHGKTIVNGQLRFASVSSLELASRCMRRWFYAYKHGLKEEPSDAMARGTKCHAEIAQHLMTGERAHLSSIVLAGMHMLPPPGPDLLVEHDMIPDLPDGKSGLALAKLRARNIPIVGAIDLIHGRPENYGSTDAGLDEPGVLKLIDHKVVGKIDTAKTGPELIGTTQMAGYAKWAFETFPGLERVRLQHNYFPVKGSPRNPSILVNREAVEKTWRRVEVVAGSMIDAAKEANPDTIDANTSDCRAYGRDCPAKHVCRAASHNSLASLVGSTAADRLLAPRPSSERPSDHSPGVQHDMTTPVAANSLIARLTAQRAGIAPPAAPTPALVAPTPALVAPVQSAPMVGVVMPVPAPPAPVQTAPMNVTQIPAPAPVAPTPDPVQVELARLQAEEAAAAAAPAAPPVSPILQMMSDIDACGFGMPNLTAGAAIAIAEAAGIEVPAGGFPGSGELAQYTFENIEMLEPVLAEVRELAAKRDAANPPTVQTDVTTTPTSTEAPAAAPKKRGRPPKVAPVAVPTTVTSTETIIETTVTDSVATAPATDTVMVRLPYAREAVAMSASDAAALGRGPSEPVFRGPSPQPAGAINVFVDCLLDGMQAQSIWPLVDQIIANMSEDAATPGPDGNLVVTDFRCSDPQGKYGFGRWKGVLAAALRACPGNGMLKPGNYLLDGAMGEIGGVVSETMRQIARATGGFYVKGAR